MFGIDAPPSVDINGAFAMNLAQSHKNLLWMFGWSLLLAPTNIAKAQLDVPARWEYTAPLINPEQRAHDPSRAQKDPTVVFHDGKWHVFMTVKLPNRSAIEHCSFERWENADSAKRTILTISDSDYYCAPQVFYFTPHQKWYLVYQMGVPGNDKMWVAYSTTTDIEDPNSWTRAQPILDGGAKDTREVGGLDYWIICDEHRAYLFFTSLNGKMWRMSTELEQFPSGFDDCQIAIEAKVFEASHTYRLKGLNKYLTIIEENGRRHYKAYLADRLDGPWVPIRDTEESPFAGAANIQPAPGVAAWTDNISHGELIRDGIDQTLTVDPNQFQMLFQGVLEQEKRGIGYGQFPWRLGLLSPVAQESGRLTPSQLVGSWNYVFAVKDGERLTADHFDGQSVDITEESITLNARMQGQAVKFVLKYKLDPTNPVSVALEITESPFGAGSTADGIIRLHDGRLRICYPPRGGPAPKSFAAENGSGHYMFELERQ